MRGNPIYVNFEGTRYRLPDLCRLKNVNYPLVKYRLLNLNWSIEDSFFTPKIEPEQSKERRVHRRKLHKANYYLKNREHFVQKQRDRYALQKEGNWERRVDNAIEEYHVCMRRYYTKEFRMYQYKSLNKFYKELIAAGLQKAA